MKWARALPLMLILTVTSPIDAASNPTATVVVRIYNYAMVPVERLAGARTATDVVFESTGIALRWIDCRVPQSESGASCTVPLGERGDLMLRLMDSVTATPRVERRVVALGTSMLDRERRGGVLMTVDLLPVRTIAEQASIDLPTLLGRAIAHEIGHLLLGTSEHPRVGLMRALWSYDELSGVKSASWRFSPQEAQQMRHGLAAGGRSAN